MSITTNTPRGAGEAMVEGINAHLRKVRALIKEFGDEVVALQKLETALKAANDRLDRGSGLITMETEFLGALVKREAAKKNEKVVQLTSEPPAFAELADKVESDLELLTSGIVSEKKS